MSDSSLEQTESQDPVDTGTAEAGQLYVEENATETITVQPVPTAELEAKITIPRQVRNRAGTVEHLAVRRPVTPIDTSSIEMKERLSELRSSITKVVTGYRWGNLSLEDAAEQIIPLLMGGSIYQWIPVLVPFLLEIDRAGDFIPVWLSIIEQEDDRDLAPDANPAETMLGRARRIAILMLGNYKTFNPPGQRNALGFTKQSKQNTKSASNLQDLAQYLGKLAGDPTTSFYATQSLAKQATTSAMQALITALKDAQGWAKVDIIEACLSLEQPRFYEIVLASGLDRVTGLESYVAVPIYRKIPLESYLRRGNEGAPRLSQQAALIFGQVLLESMKANPEMGTNALPIVFEQDFTPLANALFEKARSSPSWHYALALHRLATLLGRYWRDMSRGTIQDSRILEPIHGCLPMMNDVERWMNGPGRDVLLEALSSSDEEAFIPVVKILGELREPRAIAILINQVGSTTTLSNRAQAIRIVHMSETLARLDDRRAVQPLQQMVGRIIDVAGRTTRAKRRDNLPFDDENIPASIVYAAVIRAFVQLNDRTTLDFIVRAANDFDPFVRVEVLEALKRLDPSAEDARSKTIAREALNDPHDAIVHLACQLVAQYRDTNAVPVLQRIAETRPAQASAAYDALRQLGQ